LEPVRAALVGVSGIGGYHRKIMYQLEEIDLVAAAERYPDREKVKPHVDELKEQGVPVYPDLETMLDEVEGLEMLTVAVPHHWHAPYTTEALNRGINVLCEKPVAVRVQDGWEVARLAKEKDLLVGVDFQYTSYPHSLKLKEMITGGELGELTEVVGVMEWKRTNEYYARGDWTGKRYADGLPVFDGVMMNQAVHLMNTALQMGSRVEDHATPRSVQAELYQAHPNIEVEDIAALRADLGEATLYFYATTCCDQDYRTTLDIYGTKGWASWDTSKAVVHLDDQEEEIVLDDPSDRDAIHKNLVACIRGEERELYAPAEEAVRATLLIDGAYASAGQIRKIPWTQVKGIQHLLNFAAEQRKLLSELAGWDLRGEAVETDESFIEGGGSPAPAARHQAPRLPTATQSYLSAATGPHLWSGSAAAFTEVGGAARRLRRLSAPRPEAGPRTWLASRRAAAQALTL